MRPFPPAIALDEENPVFVPAPELRQWVTATFIEGSGPLVNDDHEHLQAAHIGFLWTSHENTKRGRPIAGQAAIPFFQGDFWSKARQTQQLVEWFGVQPDFTITIQSLYAAQLGDVDFCALIEHELYHCAQREVMGCPAYDKQGRPKWCMKPHDVEEHIGVVRRYGAVGGGVEQFVIAAQQEPLIARASVASVCGVCLR